MVQTDRPRVRPSVFIFIGKAGAQICEYLSPYYPAGQQRRLQNPPIPSKYHLLANLGDDVRDLVALLQINTEGRQANPGVAIAFPVMETFPDDKNMPRDAGPVEEMIMRAIWSVQLAERIDKVRKAGYEVSNTRTQVFIVGEPNRINAPWLARTLEIVRWCSRRLNFDISANYVLNDYNLGNDYSATLIKRSPRPEWIDHEVANFSYVFEPVIPYTQPMTVMPEGVRYITAEALLALATTGITSQRLVENGVLLNTYHTNFTDYSDYIGNISSSMISFPRTFVTQYCTTGLTSELIQNVRHTLNVGAPTPYQYVQVQEEGTGLVENIEEWVANSSRPWIEEDQWPSFKTLVGTNLLGVRQPAHKRREAHDQLGHETSNLFDLFSYDEVQDAYHNRTNRRQTWTEFTYDRCDKASIAYGQWEMTAYQTWNMIRSVLDEHARYEIDRRCAFGTNGFQLTRLFVNRVHDELHKLGDKARDWENEDHSLYIEKRDQAADMTQGQWNTNPPSPPPGGPPRMGPRGRLHLPQREADIAQGLSSRVDWKQNQIPSIPALCSIGLMGLIAAILCAPAVNLPPLLLIAIALVAITAGCVVLLLTRQKEYTTAQRDFLNLYTDYYDFQCTVRENQQRIVMLDAFSQMASDRSYRIEHMEPFLDDRINRANDDKNQTNHSLFEGPAATRDVFIANGDRLAERGQHTLATIANQVSQNRQRQSLQVWHGAIDTIRNQLAQVLEQNGQSLLDMSENEFQEYIYQFIQPVIKSYLTGRIVDISEALNNTDALSDALEQASRPLYAAVTGVRDPYQWFVCGSPQALAMAQQAHARNGTPLLPTNTLLLETTGNEFLLVVGFFRGGTPRAVDADILFPLKQNLPPPGIPTRAPDPDYSQ